MKNACYIEEFSNSVEVLVQEVSYAVSFKDGSRVRTDGRPWHTNMFCVRVKSWADGEIETEIDLDIKEIVWVGGPDEEDSELSEEDVERLQEAIESFAYGEN